MGNSRVNFDTGTGTARQVQVDDYYAFGMEINAIAANPKNEYLYNKKELQENLGLYDYGARFYDPVIARWTSVDPLAEKGRRWSPYGYGEDNSIRNIDPDGMETEVCCGGLPSEYDITGNDQPIIVNIVGAMKDAVTSAYSTLSSGVTSLTTRGNLSGMTEGSFDYSSGQRTLINSPLASNLDKAKATGNALLSFASVIPGDGPMAGMFAKTTGVKSSAVTVIKSLEAQAKDISETLNAGKNSVTIGTVDKQIRYDLVGKAHAGVGTPHSQVYNKNFVNGVLKNISRASKQAKSMTQAEIRAVRKFLEK